MVDSITYEDIARFIKIKSAPKPSGKSYESAYELASFTANCAAIGVTDCKSCLLGAPNLDIFVEWLLEHGPLTKADKLKLLLDKRK